MSASDPSPMAEHQKSNASEHNPRQGLPPAPRAAWMWKPRSKLTGSDGNAKHATSLLQLRRIGAHQWNRRFVFIDNRLFCYGKDKGRKDKQVPFELVESVRRETAEKLRREHAPKEYADFGWCLAVKGRTLLFCAESEESAAQWVGYLAALLCAMRGSPASRAPETAFAATAAAGDATPDTQTLGRGTTLAEIGAQYDEAHQNNCDGTHYYATLSSLTSPGDLMTDEVSALTPQRPQQRGASPAAATAASLPPPPLVEEDRNPTAMTTGSDVKRAAGTTFPAVTSIGQRDGKVEAEAAADGESSAEEKVDSEASVLDVSSDDTEGVDSSDGEAGAGQRDFNTLAARRSLSASAATDPDAQSAQEVAARPPPREVRYARFLLPLAADPHSHIGYRIPALESHFKSGDDASGVTFSRTMEKIGKRDNAQPREVVLTTRHLYLFSRSRMANSQQVRCIDTHDITGVVESTTDKAVLAVLVPAFHDVLLRVVPQNSCVPGTPAEVKQQLIAHLYKAHCDVHTDHRFLFRESPSVAKEIRRTEEAKYPPLVVHAADQMRAGERAGLLETFAKHADEAVYWSSMVRQVQVDRKPRLCALVVTESSIYALSDTLQVVERRTFMRDLLHVEYDQDAQSILLQCRGVDVLFNMQSSAEFDAFLRVLPAAVADGFGRILRLTPSKQLYSHAKLFSFSTLGGVGPAGASRSAVRRHRGFLWPKAKKGGGGTRLLSSFAGAEGDEAAVDVDEGDGAAFHHNIQGDYRNSQAIRLFCAQFRFVEEVLQDYDDAVALWQRYETSAGRPVWDTLRLRDTFATRMRVGEICLSAACRLLDAKECATLAKSSALELHESVVQQMGTPRAICVTTEGFLLLRNGVAAASPFTAAEAASAPLSGSATPRGSLRSRLSVAVSHISSGGASGAAAVGKDDELVLGLVEWSVIAAVVRCHSTEGSSVALLTNRTHPVDYLFHLSTAQAMMNVMAAAMGSYAQYRHGGADHTHLLPLYTAPRVQNLAVALKKTVFDPFPTVALRYTPHSFPSDRLRMAFIPDVADACRRFGDNTMYFSGVAWRVRSATLRRCDGHLDADPGPDMRRQNNHLYKSYIFVLTNVAIYHCTKGGFEVVRRTQLTDVTGITIAAHDPDTVMLTVPSEYDMYFRMAGRGAEVVARLQEAYAEWTNYGHYLPHEQQGSRTLEDYGLPVRHVSCVAALGTLTKPAYFNDLQSSRPAGECRHQTQQWHLRCLKRAIASLEKAQAAARRERRGAPQWSTWSRMRAALADRQSYLYFVQRRCFRFGLMSEDFDEMQRAQRLLRGYAEMEASATALITATSSTDPSVFRAALQRAAAVADLRLLVEEETRVYEDHLARRACLRGMLSAVRDYRHHPNGRKNLSLVALEAALLDRLAEARRLHFDPSFLHSIVQVVRVLVQRTQLQRVVCDPANQQRLSAMRDGGWVLVQQAAGEVGMTWRPPATRDATEAKSIVVRQQLLRSARAAQLALRRSAMTGEASLVHGAAALASSVLQAWTAHSRKEGRLDVPESDAVAAAAVVTALRQSLDSVQGTDASHLDEQRQQLARAVEALVAARQTHQREQTWTQNTVRDMLATCVLLEEKVTTQPTPFLCLYYSSLQSVLAMEHAMLTEQQHRLHRRQALENRELKAQRQHERDLQRRRLAAQRASSRQQRREAVVRERRQKKALALWSGQVDQLVAKLDARLAAAENETDESIRLGIRQCVHLHRWLAEAGTRYGLSPPPTQSCANAQLASRPLQPSLKPESGARQSDEALADLMSRLHSASARAQHLLDRRTRRGGGEDVARRHPSLPGTAMPAEDNMESVEQTVELPAEVQHLVATLNTEGVVAYIQEHQGGGAASLALLNAVETQWQHARSQQRWVAALHRRLHAAAVLHSRELLEAALEEADAVTYTDDAVEVARRVVTRMRAAQGRQIGESGGSMMMVAATYDPRAPSVSAQPSVSSRQPSEEADDAVEGEAESADAADGRGKDREEPASTSNGPENGATSAAAAPAAAPAAAAAAAATMDTPVPSQLDSVTTALEDVATTAVALRTSRCLDAAAPLEALYAATIALVGAALSTTSSSGDAEPTDVCVTAANPFCAPFLHAWRALLQHHVRPSGVLLKSPRSVWDLVRDMGAFNSDGNYAAPYVTRLASDFQRLYRSTDDSEAARQRADAVLLSLIFFSHRMSCVWEGLMQVGEKGRRELLLPNSLMAQPEVVRAVLTAARVCDGVQWGFESVQAVAVACLFPPAAVVVPTPQRFDEGAASSFPPVQARVSSTPSSPPLFDDMDRRADHVSVSKAAALTTPSPLEASSSAASPAVEPVVSASALESPARSMTVSAEAQREECTAAALTRLRAAVHAIAAYVTQQLRAHGTTPSDVASFFDEHRYPEVGDVVEKFVLPALLFLLSCGLTRRHHLLHSHKLWDVLTSLREGLTTSSRTLAAAEVLPIMDVVEALTDVSDPHGRSTAALGSLSDSQLDALRVRIFLRECLSRRQLFPFIRTLFPHRLGNEEWVGADSGVLWTHYSPSLCLLYPPDAPSSALLRPLLEKLSALPFVLVPDRELRG